LDLAAEDNIQVCYPTTSAQMFHLLRRQVLRKIRKPLVAITPKSLLRLPAAQSPIEEFASGKFHRVLGDPAAPPAAGVKRVFLCTGKVAYDLIDERKKRGDQTAAVVRIEQLYPWREDEVAAALGAYPNAREVVWVQDEPANMGAAFFVEPRLRTLVGKRSLRLVSRAESASPATGSHKAHQIEQKKLLDEAFAQS
jgi:2-oxoglutarate dehydrogenase E1 component